MNHTQKSMHYILLALLLCTTACNRNEVAELDFEVELRNDPAAIHAGDEVTFLFSGNADYIAFYSGCAGNNYAYKDRTNVGLNTLTMQCGFKQQYTDKEYRNKEIIFAYLSENFNGKLTAADLNAADWVKLSGKERNQLPVPTTPDSPTQETEGTIDLSAYKDKTFYIAFQYRAPKREDVPEASGGGRYLPAPRVDINPLVLHKETEDGQQISLTNAATEWGFSVVYENSEQQGNYQVNDAGLLFQPQQGKEHTDDDVIVWMVSSLINPSSIEPDRGEAIKSTEAALASYSFAYAEPGEYTATFIATNANLWSSRQVVKQLKLTVGN